MPDTPTDQQTRLVARLRLQSDTRPHPNDPAHVDGHDDDLPPWFTQAELAKRAKTTAEAKAHPHHIEANAEQAKSASICEPGSASICVVPVEPKRSASISVYMEANDHGSGATYGGKPVGLRGQDQPPTYGGTTSSDPEVDDFYASSAEVRGPIGPLAGVEYQPGLGGTVPGPRLTPESEPLPFHTGSSDLVCLFLFCELNRHFRSGGFQVGQRKRRDGTFGPSLAPSDYAKFFGSVKVGDYVYKWTASPPLIWLHHITPDDKGKIRARHEVRRYTDIITALAQEQAQDKEREPHDPKVWLGLVYEGRYGDPNWIGGPRYPNDRSFVMVECDAYGAPTTFRFISVLPEDAGDQQAIGIEFPLSQGMTKARKDRLGRPVKPTMKWYWRDPGYTITPEDAAEMLRPRPKK